MNALLEPTEVFSSVFCSSWKHDRKFLTYSGRKRIATSKGGDIKEVQRLKFDFLFFFIQPKDKIRMICGVFLVELYCKSVLPTFFLYLYACLVVAFS